MARHSEFTVGDKPFFSLGGQTHNSSSYYPNDMRRSFESARALGGNTVATPLCWDKFEPEEGHFDEDYVRAVIDQARTYDMRLVLLWFATWKNGTMEYVPAWVKRDGKRFPRTLCRDGSPTAVLSCHSENNRKADETAFCRLMKTIREYDEKENTVIGVQIENEAGILGPTRRDFGPDGERDFAAQAPGELIAWAKAHPNGRLSGYLSAAGSQPSGTWAQVFGSFGAEAMTAWYIARYIDSIAKAGKEVYDIFLYANAWLDGGSQGAMWDLGGLEYPCGGPVSKVLEIWYAACTSLDAIAPDNYQSETFRHIEASDLYANPALGWPLYVPESAAAGLNATQMFHAVGNRGAIGYHIFGCESCLTNDGELTQGAKIMRRSMTMLRNASTLIQAHRADGRMRAICQRPGDASVTLALAGWKCHASFKGGSYGGTFMDLRHRDASATEADIPLGVRDETARALLFQVGKDEFYLVGHGVRLYFARPEPLDGSIPPTMLNASHQANSMATLLVEEGSFIDGSFVPVRTRSGDEARHGVWAQADCGVIHFILAD